LLDESSKVEPDDVLAYGNKQGSSSQVTPRNLMPDELATVSGLPVFLWQTHHVKFRVGGELVLTCEDRYGNEYREAVTYCMQNVPCEKNERTDPDSMVIVRVLPSPVHAVEWPWDLQADEDAIETTDEAEPEPATEAPATDSPT